MAHVLLGLIRDVACLPVASLQIVRMTGRTMRRVVTCPSDDAERLRTPCRAGMAARRFGALSTSDGR